VNVHRVSGIPLGEHIARVAARLFYREGIHLVGVDRVASEAEVTKRTLYRYFRSKDVLIAAALRHVPRVRYPVDGTPAERIVGAFTAMRRYLASGDFRGCPYITVVSELIDAKHPARAVVLEINATRRAWFRDRAIEAGVTAPDAFADQMDVLFDGAMSGASKMSSDAPVNAAIEIVKTVLAAALPARPAARRTTAPRRTAGSRS